MANKKSKAQLKRLQKRAEARGEVYVPPLETEETKVVEKDQDETPKNELNQNDHISSSSSNADNSSSKEIKAKLSAAIQLQKELDDIKTNKELKAKERRSAKRKAEAIAVESSGCSSAAELLAWYEENGKAKRDDDNNSNIKKKSNEKEEKRKENPYIVFVGQLSYETTADDLFAHIEKELGDQHEITHETVRIRLLTDPQTKKSRGMAFVQVKDDPELLYSCLKLHRTHLAGRRINVERSAGGGRNSQTRKTKLQQYRQEQEKHMDTIVNAMLQEYKRGEIQEHGELDEGVIALCKRHSASVVQAALERYVESNGRDMDNPSAYLSYIVGKLATEGVYTDREKQDAKQKQHPRSSNKEKQHGRNSKRQKRSKDESDKGLKASSGFASEGIDMSVSDNKAGEANDLVKIFPSLGRGRGRGRGYM